MPQNIPEIRRQSPAGSRAGDPMSGCPVHQLRNKLRRASLRPTRQRIALGWLLFGKGDRHVTAEGLYEEAVGMKVPVSLATVYNTLHQFTEAGLLNEIAVDGSKTYFDTNVSPHHHFLIEGTNDLVDIPEGVVAVADLPAAPEGTEIARVDVIVRLRKTGARLRGE
jgi:Fur family transcriptional regulator, iron response regulator